MRLASDLSLTQVNLPRRKVVDESVRSLLIFVNKAIINKVIISIVVRVYVCFCIYMCVSVHVSVCECVCV